MLLLLELVAFLLLQLPELPPFLDLLLNLLLLRDVLWRNLLYQATLLTVPALAAERKRRSAGSLPACVVRQHIAPSRTLGSDSAQDSEQLVHKIRSLKADSDRSGAGLNS